MTYEVVKFGSFPDILELKLSLRSGLWKAGCDTVRLYVLQSYRSCTFCKRKTRGETQFWIELAAPCTLANHKEINNDDTLQLILSSSKQPSIAMAQIASDVNAYCYRHVPYDVINKRYLASCGRWPAENAECFAESLNDFIFIDISVFTAYFAFGFLYTYCIVFTNRVTISY